MRPSCLREAITGSPPTTRLSLFASATSMPSPNAAIEPEPGRSDEPVQHQIGPIR